MKQSEKAVENQNICSYSIARILFYVSFFFFFSSILSAFLFPYSILSVLSLSIEFMFIILSPFHSSYSRSFISISIFFHLAVLLSASFPIRMHNVYMRSYATSINFVFVGDDNGEERKGATVRTFV